MPKVIKPDNEYICGSFLVNAVVHQVDSISRYVYVELLNPERLVVKRVRLLRSDQGFVGHIDIPEGVVKGAICVA